MRKIDKISQILEKITSIYLTKGVQPSEVANAIFDKEYNEIAISKESDVVTMVVAFKEFDDVTLKAVTHQMRYTYNKDQFLLKVEQKIGKKAYRVQWDRDVEITNLLIQFTDAVKTSDANIDLNKVISTLPAIARPQLSSYLQLVA